MQDPPPNVLHGDNDVDMRIPVPLEALHQAEWSCIGSGIVLMSVDVLRHSSGLVPVRPVHNLSTGGERGYPNDRQSTHWPEDELKRESTRQSAGTQPKGL